MLNFLNNNDDPDLQQGQLLLDKKQNLILRGEKSQNLLEQTTSSELGSIETFSSENNSSATNLKEITAHETNFNQTLGQYKIQYQLLMENLLNADRNDNNTVSPINVDQKILSHLAELNTSLLTLGNLTVADLTKIRNSTPKRNIF